MMSTWEDVFDQIIYNEVMFSTPDRPTPPAEQKAPPLFNQAIMDLFTAGGNDTAVPDLLTTIVENDHWWVPIDAKSNKLETMQAEPGEFRQMLEVAQPPAPKKKQKKTPLSGRGGILLPVYGSEPEGIATTKMDGRQLVRQLPKSLDGLLIRTKEQSDFEIDSSHFELMRTLADECDLEEWLTVPAPGQVEKLLNARFYAEFPHTDNGTAKISTNDKLALIHTRPDRRGLCYNKYVPMTGQELFRLLADENASGAQVYNKIGRGENKLHSLVLSPAFIHAIIRGEDIRPGTKPLPAQCLDEIKLWLRFRNFPYHNQRFLDASLEGEKLVRVAVAESSTWRALETKSLEDLKKPGPTLSPVFSLPAADQSTETTFGPNPSHFLCPGLLALELGGSAWEIGKHPEKLWKPGRWLLFGRLLDKKEVEDSKKRAAMARELLKLLPTGADAIPLSAIRSFKGMEMFHEHPTAFTRDWIERTVRQAEKYTKTWVGL